MQTANFTIAAADGTTTPLSPGLKSWRERILHRAEEMERLLGEVTAALEGHGYSARDVMGVRLALEEAIVNGLRHGNRGDPTKCVRIRYYVGAHLTIAKVEDEGPGFDPELVPDPTLPENLDHATGRGLLLMRHYMTWTHFSGRGNRVTLGKLRSR
jgi:serine/threonine-protein kinase RsbW